MAEMDSEKEAVPDFSPDRDESIQELIDALPILNTSEYLTSAVELDPRTLKPVDSYETVFGMRALGALSVDRKMNVAAAVLIKPLSVWRDFLKDREGRESTTLEYYFAIIKPASGINTFSLVVVRRNVIAKVLISKIPEDLLRLVNGVQLYKNY